MSAPISCCSPRRSRRRSWASAASRATPASLGGDEARQFPILSGGAEDILVLKPDVVAASDFDKRSTREILKAHGLNLVEFPVPRTLAEVSEQIRQMGDLAGHPDRAAAEIARLDAAIAGAKQAVAGRHLRVLPLSRRGWVAGQRQLCRRAPGRGRTCQRRRRTRHRFRRVCLAGGDRQAEAGFPRGLATPATAPRMTAAPSCCIRRWSVSIREQSASSFPSG